MYRFVLNLRNCFQPETHYITHYFSIFLRSNIKLKCKLFPRNRSNYLSDFPKVSPKTTIDWLQFINVLFQFRRDNFTILKYLRIPTNMSWQISSLLSRDSAVVVPNRHQHQHQQQHQHLPLHREPTNINLWA